MADQLPDDQGLNVDDIDMRSYIKSAINQLGPTVSKEQKKEYAKLFIKIFEQGACPREAMQISDNDLSQIYSYAFYLFSKEKYKEACELFKMLFTLQPSNSDFATGLAVCHHRLKNYDYAIQLYLISSMLDRKNPISLFYAYDCYINLKDDLNARMMLSNVIVRAGEQPVYQKIKKEAQILVDQLQQKILLEKTEAKSS